MSPREVMRDDPGPWSVASPVFQGRAGRPDKRRPVSPAGLMLSPPPQVGLELIGIDPAATTAGAGRIEIFGGLRESARAMRFIDDGARIEAVGPQVIRTWTLANLAYPEEHRPESDPVAEVANPVAVEDLESGLASAVRSPDGALAAVPLRERGGVALALLRTEDRAVVRWIRGALSAAWSDDGEMIAVGGDWGAILGRHLGG